MSYLHSIRDIIGQADLFYSSELLRFKGDTEYKTFTGGIISIMLVVMVIMGFFSMIGDTLNKTAISATLSENKSNNPTLFNLTTDSTHNFMFGLLIQPQDMSFTIDLNNGPRYFDVSLVFQQVRYSIIENLTTIPMQQCTDAHWSMMPEVVSKADYYQYNKWLCPKIGQVLPLQGSFSSSLFSQVVMIVSQCKNQTDPSRPCAPQTQIDQLFEKHSNFYFVLNYINTVINPTQTQYLSYYLQAMDYVIFSKTQGSQGIVFVSDYSITTDNSFWPFSSYQTDIGTVILEKAINHPYSASTNNGYVQMVFAKSFNSLVYQRQVQKISAVFSYIGGLIGAISAVLFFLKVYTKVSLQMNIAMKLFTEERKIQVTMKNIQSRNQIQEKQSMKQKMRSFNFLSFFYLLIYKFLSSVGCNLKWKAAKVYQTYQQQVFSQLDVTTLIKRVIALENCLSLMLEDHQIQGLRHSKKMNCQRAKQLREMLVQNEEQSARIHQKQTQRNGVENKVANASQNPNFQILDAIISPVNDVEFTNIEASACNIQKVKMDDIRKTKVEKVTADKDLFKLQVQNQGKRDQDMSQEAVINLKLLLQKSKKYSFESKIWQNLQDQLKCKIERGDEVQSNQKVRSKERENSVGCKLLVQSNFDVYSIKY